ncbi:hypothetical protein SAMN02744765_3845 [Pantoea agglomerans]|nr:hypothetical protein SAMN02744765_3845 [Pantoea agglomerans]
MSANDNPKTVPNALPDGYRFNEFEIKEVIGGGGFGIVYRAWDHQLETHYCNQRVHAGVAGSPCRRFNAGAAR